MTFPPVGLLLLIATAAPPPETLNVLVNDSFSDATLTPKVVLNSEIVTVPHRIPDDSQSHVMVEVSIDAGAAYRKRTITYYLEGLRQPKLAVQLYLTPNEAYPRVNRNSVKEAAAFLNETEVDRALSRLEAVGARMSPAMKDSQFGLYHQYNLWRAYYLHCTSKFSAYCDNAKQLGEELKAWHDRDADLFTAERIRMSEIDATAKQIELHGTRVEFLRAKWEYERGDQADALRFISRVQETIAEDSTLYGKLGTDKEDIARWAAKIRRKIDAAAEL